MKTEDPAIQTMLDAIAFRQEQIKTYRRAIKVYRQTVKVANRGEQR